MVDKKHKKLIKSNKTVVQVQKLDLKIKRSLITLMAGRAAFCKAVVDVAKTAAAGNWFQSSTVH